MNPDLKRYFDKTFTDDPNTSVRTIKKRMTTALNQYVKDNGLTPADEPQQITKAADVGSAKYREFPAALAQQIWQDHIMPGAPVTSSSCRFYAAKVGRPYYKLKVAEARSLPSGKFPEQISMTVVALIANNRLPSNNDEEVYFTNSFFLRFLIP